MADIDLARVEKVVAKTAKLLQEQEDWTESLSNWWDEYTTEMMEDGFEPGAYPDDLAVFEDFLIFCGAVLGVEILDPAEQAALDEKVRKNVEGSQ